MNLYGNAIAVLLAAATLGAQTPPFSGNNNRPERLGEGHILLLSLGYSDLTSVPDNGHIISPTQQLQYARELEQIIANNSYEQYTVQVKPGPGESANAYRLIMPKTEAQYQSWANSDPMDFPVGFLLDVIDAAEAANLSPLTYDHIVYYTGDKNGPQGAWVQSCNLPFQAIGTSGGVKDVVVTGAHQGGYAVAHELEHVYQSAHANCWRSAFSTGEPPSFQMAANSSVFAYGDPFDVMGLGGGCAPRVCRGMVQPDQWAPSTAIHVNPVRKWQEHWLTDADIKVVSKSSAWPSALEVRIHDIADSAAGGESEYRAVEIPNGHYSSSPESPYVKYGEVIPESLFLYYRGNEPKSQNGVTVAYATKEKTGYPNRLVHLDRGLGLANSLCVGATGPLCVPAGGYPCMDTSQKVPCEDASLHLGEMFLDPSVGVGIYVQSIDPNHKYADIAIMFDNVPEVTNRHTPIVDIKELNMPAGRIIGYNGVVGGSTSNLQLEVSAYDPDYAPNNPQMWDNIVSVEYWVRIPPRKGTQWVYHGSVNAGELPVGQSLPLEFDLSAPALEQLYPGEFAAATRSGGMSIVATTSQGTIMRGGIRFYIDYAE